MNAVNSFDSCRLAVGARVATGTTPPATLDAAAQAEFKAIRWLTHGGPVAIHRAYIALI